MGLRRETKAVGNVGEAARDAWDAGQLVFTPLLTSTNSAGASGVVEGWGQMIEEIESVGWKLDQWAVTSWSSAGANYKQATPLFRR